MKKMAFWVDCSIVKSKPALLMTAKVKFQVKSDYFSKGFPINSIIRSHSKSSPYYWNHDLHIN